MEATLTKGTRLTGTARTKYGKQITKEYKAGKSVRALAEESGRSYGFVHRVLQESGVKFRSRGGKKIKK